MEIVIRDTHQRGKNKKKTLEVVETDTLESLKARISEAFGIAPTAQSLQCYGRILIGDALTLESLGIKDEAVIIVTQPESSLQYSDGNNGNGNNGLYYEMKCTNTDCTTYGQPVNVMFGYGTSIFGKDRWCCVCPACKGACDGAAVEGVLATNCKWMVDGFTDKGVAKHDEGVTSGTQILSLVTRHTWSHLEITTSPLPDTSSS